MLKSPWFHHPLVRYMMRRLVGSLTNDMISFDYHNYNRLEFHDRDLCKVVGASTSHTKYFYSSKRERMLTGLQSPLVRWSRMVYSNLWVRLYRHILSHCWCDSEGLHFFSLFGVLLIFFPCMRYDIHNKWQKTGVNSAKSSCQVVSKYASNISFLGIYLSVFY